jgi:glycosyl transferase family 25
MPPIYVINLDRDVERMASLAGNLQALALPFERISAVLGKEVPNWEQLVDAELYASRNREPMPRPGEVGCYLSHLKAMEEFLRTDALWCVILEDDVEVRPECVEVLAALDAKDDWDLVKLFCFHYGMPMRKRALTPTHHLVVHLTRTTSSAAYAVNRRAAELAEIHATHLRAGGPRAGAPLGDRPARAWRTPPARRTSARRRHHNDWL